MADSNLPQTIKNLRQMHGYTQQYVAEFLSISRQGYAHYEQGRRNPDYHIIFKLASLYRVSIDEIVSSDQLSILIAKEESSFHSSLKSEDKEILDLYHKLLPIQKEDYLALLRTTVQNNNKRKLQKKR